MKKCNIVLMVGLLGLYSAGVVAEGNSSDDNDWYDKAKHNTEVLLDKTKQAAKKGIDKTTQLINQSGVTGEKVFDATKEAAKTGIDKTTRFINKTGRAASEGVKAFKQSYTKPQPEARAKPPAYLSVAGFKWCLATKDMGSWQAYCLPKYRPAMCKEASFKALQRLKSPPPC